MCSFLSPILAALSWNCRVEPRYCLSYISSLSQMAAKMASVEPHSALLSFKAAGPHSPHQLVQSDHLTLRGCRSQAQGSCPNSSALPWTLLLPCIRLYFSLLLRPACLDAKQSLFRPAPEVWHQRQGFYFLESLLAQIEKSCWLSESINIPSPIPSTQVDHHVYCLVITMEGCKDNIAILNNMC